MPTPRIGDLIRPELGRTDYSMYLQGAAAGGEALGAGLASAMKDISAGLEKRKETQKKIKTGQRTMKGIADFLGEDDPIGRRAAALAEEISNPELRLSEAEALVDSAGPIVRRRSNQFLKFQHPTRLQQESFGDSGVVPS